MSIVITYIYVVKNSVSVEEEQEMALLEENATLADLSEVSPRSTYYHCHYHYHYHYHYHSHYYCYYHPPRRMRVRRRRSIASRRGD